MSTNTRKRIAIVGSGLIGTERVNAIRTLEARGRAVELVGVLDPFTPHAKAYRERHKVEVLTDPAELYKRAPEWVIVATPHDAAVRVATEALERNVNVLVEKPLGRDLAEAELLASAARRPGQLWAGFNYRFFAGVAAAFADLRRGAFGKLISINMILGHGHQPDARAGWKLDPVRAGGGCLIDPGVHLLDLCQLIHPGVAVRCIGGTSWNGFWNTGIEEETHLLLDAGGVAVNLQVSIVRWRSTMRIEINGVDGYGIVSGRNRSFGPQRYVRGKRWGWQGGKSQKDSEELVLETTGEDVFADELDALLFPSPTNVAQPCDAHTAVAAMRLLQDCRNALGSERVTP